MSKKAASDSSLKSESELITFKQCDRIVDISTQHKWLKDKYPGLITVMVGVVAETEKAILLRSFFHECSFTKERFELERDFGCIVEAWIPKSLITIWEHKK
ncbi:MAG: hypothetical protein LBP70_01430 [Mycoplasmataceae bacterium]|jgi:hypothetical protein|nr:hypothetical protein [Mycoplasmataceae bacterium]